MTLASTPRVLAARALRRAAALVDPGGGASSLAPRERPICGFRGPFRGWGTTGSRADAQRPGCGSAERHRRLKVALDEKPGPLDGARMLHFGQDDHVRYYGRDFRDRVRRAGFDLTERGATGEECVRYALLRGERVFFARKPAASASDPGEI